MSRSDKIEGPTPVVPPMPEPYYSCNNCVHFNKSMKSTGGLRRAPSYYKTCRHPHVLQFNANGRQIDFSVRNEHKTITPDWCPILIERGEREHVRTDVE